MMTRRLEGNEAIEYARANNVLLSKFADPTEDARDNVTPGEAQEIAAEDPRLVYVDVEA